MQYELCLLPSEADPEETKGLPPEFYERLKTMAREGALTVKFMGGEPTLYMDTIKKVVAAVPGATFAIATNGKHLETFLPFFRAHHFKIASAMTVGMWICGDSTRWRSWWIIPT